MNRAFRPEPEASAELEDAVVWYDGQRPGLGFEFLQAVDAALEHIARWPDIGRRVPGVPNDVPARRFPVTRFPYHIFYMEWDGVEKVNNRWVIGSDHRAVQPGEITRARRGPRQELRRPPSLSRPIDRAADAQCSAIEHV